MTKDELKQAFREAASHEFAGIPMSENEVSYEFSDRFNRKMSKVIRAERSKIWRATNTTAKRVAVAVIAIMLLALTACSIPSVRAAVVSFITETFDNCVHFFTRDLGANSITRRYQLQDLPEGFTEHFRDESDAAVSIFYKRDNGETLCFTQSAADSFDASIDNEFGELTMLSHQDIDVYLYETAGCLHAMWLYDGYAFELTYYGDCSRDDVLKLIEALE